MESASNDGFIYLDGFGELFWDGIYWNGQVQLPVWESYQMNWLEQQAAEFAPEELTTDIEELLNSGEMDELREAAERDPEAKAMLEDLERLASGEDEEEAEPGWITLSFTMGDGGEEDEGDDEEAEPLDMSGPALHPAQIAAAHYIRENAAKVQEVILADALEIYQRLQPKLPRPFPQAPKFPRLTRPDQLKDHLALAGVSPLMVAKDGMAYTAYYLTCSWDLENGLPYILHKDRIVMISLEEDYDANLAELLEDGGEVLK